MKTGRPIETESARYRYTPVRLSPSPVGAHHWPPMAFNPTTGLVYYPGQETSMVVGDGREVRIQGRAVEPRHAHGRASRRRWRAAAAAADPKAPPMGGFFVAWDPVAKKARVADSVPAERRRAVDRRPVDLRRQLGGKFFALDPVSGKTLWESQLLPAASRRRSATSWTASSTSR